MSQRPKSVLGNRRGKNRRVQSKSERGPSPAWALAKLLFTFTLGVSVIVGAGIGSLHGWEALMRSERLKVQNIVYSGNSRVRDVELAAYTGVALGDSVLSLDLDAMALQLRRHPWIESARVRRKLPNSVMVEVREHVPALVVSLGEVYLASTEGVLFKHLTDDDPSLFPVLTGLAREDVNKRPDHVRARIQDAVALAQEIAKRPELGQLDELHFDQDLGFSMVTTQGTSQTVRVHLGRAPESRLLVAQKALARLKALKLNAAVVWADGDKNKGVQVRLRDSIVRSETPTLVATAK